ncbi:hypothetical protein ACFE04_009083 [Oxalis oulophora]
MGNFVLKNVLCLLCVLLLSCVLVTSQTEVAWKHEEQGTVFVQGKSAIGEIDNDFICATIDWWPPSKCDYGFCSWHHSTMLTLDLKNQVLLNAIKAFSPLKIRLGGTLEDKVTYDTPDNKIPCTHNFEKNNKVLFGFNEGCLPMARWDELNDFFKKSGANIIFGLNVLAGKTQIKKGGRLFAEGPWNSTNAESFIRYTVNKNYTISGWELGNEVCGDGIGISVEVTPYNEDTIKLRKIVEDVYKNISPKPLIVAPGGFYKKDWFTAFVAKSYADVVSHHMYNVGPGSRADVVDKILDPVYLASGSGTYRNLQNVIKTTGSKAKAWISESGGVYNSGRRGVTDAFVMSYWYLDQLGMSAQYGTSTYCRQTLIGGNYGFIDATTYKPNPDYYSALLWHRLMGKYSLNATFTGTDQVHTYVHCAKQSKGITVLILNWDTNVTYTTKVEFEGATSNNIQSLRTKTAEFASEQMREEYHLTGKDGDIHSRTMMLNGKMLYVKSTSTEIPRMEPKYVKANEPIEVAPRSIVFAHLPYVHLSACY